MSCGWLTDNLPDLAFHAILSRQPRSHGFYRFFAWEAILGLFLLNVDFWFRDPFAWYQIIAWTLLFASSSRWFRRPVPAGARQTR